MDIKNIKESFEYLDTINDKNSLYYDDCKMNSYQNVDWYKAILKEVLKDKPRRVVDIGSNLNQYGYLFANEDIEYIGIDIETTLPNCYGIMQPIISEKIKYIQADYNNIKQYFKDDVIISCLCVGYQVDIKDVLYKKLIVNSFNENRQCSAKVFEKESN